MRRPIKWAKVLIDKDASKGNRRPIGPFDQKGWLLAFSTGVEEVFAIIETADHQCKEVQLRQIQFTNKR